MIQLLNGNTLKIPLADGSAHVVITSPPYWGLRDYGTATWEGGDPPIDVAYYRDLSDGELQTEEDIIAWNGGLENIVRRCDHTPLSSQGMTGQRADRTFTATPPFRDTCGKCGAVRIDNQLGLERVPDCLGWATGAPCGECYICHTVAWAREVRRVLRDDGTFWMNIGDSYVSNPGDRNKVGGIEGQASEAKKQAGACMSMNKHDVGLKPKDLCMIPARVALALQADGWWLRSDTIEHVKLYCPCGCGYELEEEIIRYSQDREIVWSKPNPMPESVRDRPTKSHEMLYIFSKQPRYYYDAEAVREENADPNRTNYAPGKEAYSFGNVHDNSGRERRNDGFEAYKNGKTCNGRNRRSVWHIATAPYSGAHFATYPPALVEPCIKAGTSERGCCPKCGKQWVRVVETAYIQHRQRGDWEERLQNKNGENRSPGMSKFGVAHKDVATLGWRPDCMCYGLEIIEDQPDKPGKPKDMPDEEYKLLLKEWQAELAIWFEKWYRLKPLYDACTTAKTTIFDPFAGSGTTLLVARKLGRSAVGLDLSMEYLTSCARSRLSLDALDEFTNGRQAAGDLSDLPLFQEVG